jgi:hypothetical protein
VVEPVKPEQRVGQDRGRAGVHLVAAEVHVAQVEREQSPRVVQWHPVEADLLLAEALQPDIAVDHGEQVAVGERRGLGETGAARGEQDREHVVRPAGVPAFRGGRWPGGRLLSEALTLWRGDPADDIALHGESVAILTALAQRRLTAEEAWADAHLALGSGIGLIGRLRSLAAEQPLRERIRGQLILALFRAGRNTEALAEFSALHRRMITDLGIEPSLPLQRLHRQILADDPALTAPARIVIPRQLPPSTSDFTGRASQLEQLRALLSRPRVPSPIIAAINGPAGTGKTALAMRFAHEVADQFPHGQLFVNLRGWVATVERLPSSR